MSTKKLNLKSTSMPQDMHQTVLDQLKKIVEGAGKPTIQITKDLKTTFQQKWQGQWQVIVGEKQLATYFNYIEITFENKTFLIFRRVNKYTPLIQEIRKQEDN